MPIRIQLFAGLADEVGAGSLSFDLPAEDYRLKDLKAELTRLYPGAERFLLQSLTSVNRSYAPEDWALRDGDEVSLIPPLSGG